MRLFKRTNQSKSVKICPNQLFRDGRETFEKGQVYRVEIGRARYFERNGWLEGSLGSPPPEVVLDIHNSELGHDGGL